METALIITSICLLVTLIVLLYRHVLLKSNIKRFSSYLDDVKHGKIDCPVTVSTFDKDIITLANEVNAQIAIRKKLANDFDKNKQQLKNIISGISHDFRTPLTASLGYLEMIEKSGDLSEKQSAYLHIVIQKNLYLKELSDEFFDLTMVNNNAKEIAFEQINLSNVLTDTLLEQHTWIEDRKIRTEFDIADGIIIKTSPHYLERIINNLMSNASKYTLDMFGVYLKRENGVIKLKVYNTLSDSNSVDTNKVFEPFYRMDSRTSSGSGLGLYIVDHISELLGYTVTATKDDNVFSVEIIIK